MRAIRALLAKEFDESHIFRIDPATSRIVDRIPLHTRAVDGIIVSHGLVWAAVPPSQ